MRCPKGFVVPDNPLDSRVLFVPGSSGCAKECVIAGYFTVNEFKILRILVIVASVIGLPMISMVLWTWLSNRIRMEKQYLIFCFVALSAFFSLWMIIGSGGTKCHDNATEIDQSDGFSICVIQGALIVYCLLAISFAWFVSCFELFHRLVWKKSIRHHNGRIRVHLCFIFVLPTFPIVYASLRKMFGYDRILPFCMFAYTAPQNVDFAFLYVPMFAATIIGAILLLAVMWHTICTTKESIVGIQGSTQNAGNLNLHNVALQALPAFHRQSVQVLGLELPSTVDVPSNRAGSNALGGSLLGSNSFLRKSTNEENTHSFNFLRLFSAFTRKLRVLRTLSSFFSFYLILWLTMIGYKTYDYFYLNDVTESVSEWTNCIFQNYNGIDDDSWLSVCGEKASYHAPKSLAIWFVLCMSGHSIFITLIYMPAVYEAFSQFLKTRSYAQNRKKKNVKKSPIKPPRIQPINQIPLNTNDRHDDAQPHQSSPISLLLQEQGLSPGSGDNHSRITVGSKGDNGLEMGLNDMPVNKTFRTKSPSIRVATHTDMPMGNRNRGNSPTIR